MERNTKTELAAEAPDSPVRATKSRFSGTLYSLPTEQAEDVQDVVRLSRGLTDFLVRDWSNRPAPDVADTAELKRRLIAELVDEIGIDLQHAEAFAELRMLRPRATSPSV